MTLLAFPASSLAQGTSATVSPPSATTPVPPPVTPVTPAPAVEMVDINTVDVATLDSLLEGIGEKRAQAIVDFREQYGPFKTIYDLEQVSGIGPKTIEKNKHRMIVSVPEATASTATATPAPGSVTPPVLQEKDDPEADSAKDSDCEESKNCK